MNHKLWVEIFIIMDCRLYNGTNILHNKQNFRE